MLTKSTTAPTRRALDSTAQIERAWKCLWKACRSVAQALTHEENRDITGTEGLEDAQECAMPKPQPHQATRAVGVSVILARLTSGDRAWRCLLRACHRRSGAKGTKAPLPLVGRSYRTPATASPSHVGSPSVRLPTGLASHRPRKAA